MKNQKDRALIEKLQDDDALYRYRIIVTGAREDNRNFFNLTFSNAMGSVTARYAEDVAEWRIFWDYADIEVVDTVDELVEFVVAHFDAML